MSRQRKQKLLSLGLDEKTAEHVQKFAFKEASHETDRATYQAMEALVHNLNTMHSRAGAQVPFSSLNYGTDTSPEGRMVIEKHPAGHQSGPRKWRDPHFPHPHLQGEGRGQLQSRRSQLRFVQAGLSKFRPNGFSPTFPSSTRPLTSSTIKKAIRRPKCAYMGCRTRVIGKLLCSRILRWSRGSGNLSFTSVNLPRLAIKANGNVDAFFESLGKMVDLVIDQLLARFRIQASKKVRNYPFLMGQGVWAGL